MGGSPVKVRVDTTQRHTVPLTIVNDSTKPYRQFQMTLPTELYDFTAELAAKASTEWSKVTPQQVIRETLARLKTEMAKATPAPAAKKRRAQ